jgi:hypothetical protein
MPISLRGQWDAAVGLQEAFDNSYTPQRFFRWTGAPPVAASPGAGGAVDGVSIRGGKGGYLACPGFPFLVEAGGAFNAGASLATTSDGRAVEAGSGQVVVARALQASSGAGQVVWAVFTR